MSRKKLFALSIILVLTFVFAASACSSGSKDSLAPGNRDNENKAPGGDYDYTPGEPPNISERKVIYEAQVSVTVADVEKAVRDINTKAADLGGYIANSNRDNNSELPTARITYHIPQSRYTEFIDFARGLGEPGAEWIDSADVTEKYVDLEARLANRLVHEERLLAILSKTGSVEELLSVERELSRVREDIEVIEGQLRYLQEKVALATVTVSLSQKPGATEVPRMKPLGVKETLRRALKAVVTSSTLFLDVISCILIIIAALLPFAIPALAILWLILYLHRKKKKQTQA